MTTKKMPTKTTYCYCRVSQNMQSTAKGGFGMTRQQNLLMNYVETYTDTDNLGYTISPDKVVFLNAEGVSGFSGKNISEGSVLLNFIESVKNGTIKNAVLALENIDRFSRANPQEAALLFLQLIKYGCNIHEAENEIVHHKNSDLNLITSGLIRSNKESLRKQKMSLKNWDKRFDAVVKDKKALTGRCPAWLYVEDGEYKIITEHSRQIKTIFELYLKGFGQGYICKKLNDDGGRYNDKTWSTWLIHRLLNDERLTGVHVTKSDNRTEFDGIQMYPEIISTVDFKSAQQRLKAPGRDKKINKNANSLFSGFLVCGICNSGHLIVMFNKGKRYCTCTHRAFRNGRCVARGFKYEIFELAVLNHVRNFDFNTVTDNNHHEEVEELKKELINTVLYLDEVQADIDKVDIPDPSDRRILKNLQMKVTDIEAQIENLESSDNIGSELKSISTDISSELLDRKNVLIRQEFNARLRRVIKSIHAFRYHDSILIQISYFIKTEQQIINIDAKSGEVLGHSYIEDDKVMISYGGNEYHYENGEMISK
jgi:DNA invertase Pin-like site-specific DNA recombinase